MSNHVYKTIELTGSSTSSSDDAVRSALTKAAKTIRGMRWFQRSNSPPRCGRRARSFAKQPKGRKPFLA